MGGGAQPASRSFQLCGVVLGAIALLAAGTSDVGAQTAAAARPAVVKQAKVVKPTKRTVTKRVAARKPAPKATAVPHNQQTTAQTTAQPIPLQPSAAKQTRRTVSLRSSKHARHRRLARPVAEPADNNAAAALLGERLSNNTITVLAGGINSTDLAVANDLAAVLDDGDELRIMSIIGRGGGRNIRDVRFIKGVDLGFTQSNLLARFRRGGEFGPLDDKIAYVAKLFNEELHLVVRADSGFTSIEQLAGNIVNFGAAGGGTDLTARDIFARLGVAARAVNLSDSDAIGKLRRREIAATVLLGGAPTPALAALGPEFRLLPVPYAKPLQDDYLPATLAAQDYPGLIEAGRAVDTVAVGVVLIAYNWPKDSDRYRRIERFVETFFDHINDLQVAPRHPKWREVNLAAVLPGLPRFAAAQDWIKRRREEASQEQFERFVETRGAGPVSGDERERLFREFLQWTAARERR